MYFDNVILGGNFTIINGRIVTDGGEMAKGKKIDRKKTGDASNLEKILIDSRFANVNISVSNLSKEVEVHLYGEANVDGDVDFDVRIVNSELRIKLKSSGNCYISNLKLDVTVPQKTFKVICVNSASGNIKVSEKVSTEQLEIKTKSGSVETRAMFTNASITTMSGDVDFFANATKDIRVEISTMSGDISSKFNNIGHLNLHANSMSGDITNCHKGIGYTADVNASAMSGDINVW